MGMQGRMMLGGMGDDTKAYDHRIARRLLAYLLPHRRRLAAVFVLVVLAAAAANAGPLLLKIGIDDGICGGALDCSDPTQVQSNGGLLAIVGMVYIGTLGLMWALNYFQVLLTAAIGQASLRQLRNDMFAKLQRLSLSYFSRHPLGAVMSRITNDVDVVSEGMTSLLRVAIVRVARDYDLEPGWFNDAAKLKAPALPVDDPILVFDGVRLRVYAVPARYALAMKLVSARDVDKWDIPALLAASDIKTRAELYRLVQDAYPSQMIPAATTYIIDQAWEAHQQNRAEGGGDGHSHR